MNNLGKIKNKKLRTQIEESYKFSILEEKKQNELINKMAKLSEKELELSYIPFFEKENNEEDEINEIKKHKTWFMDWDTEIDLERVLKKKEWGASY